MHRPLLRSRLVYFLATLVLAFAVFDFPLPVLAQGVTADVIGTVVDPTGDRLPQVKITVVNVETELKRATETDSGGNFSVTLLPVGRYIVTAELVGFKSTKMGEITLGAGRPAETRHSHGAWPGSGNGRD